METNKKITNKDFISMFIRSNIQQASFNFERMQAAGFCYVMHPIIKKLYTGQERIHAMKRHLEFFNTNPYMAAPIFGVIAALEEKRANGAPIDDETINGVKIGLMGPFAGIGDPIFWGTVRPILAAVGASMALTGSIIGPILFFLVFNVMRLLVRWYGIKYGYEQGINIIKQMSGDKLKKLTEGISLMGLFVMGALVSKWTTINVPLVISNVTKDDGKVVTTTLQNILDQLLPGLLALLLTFLCITLLKKKINPIIIIFGLFAVGIVGYALGILA